MVVIYPSMKDENAILKRPWSITGEHTRPRVSPSAPPPTASSRSIGEWRKCRDVVGEAPTTAREGACAPLMEKAFLTKRTQF